jgi:hypothetical protein
MSIKSNNRDYLIKNLINNVSFFQFHCAYYMELILFLVITYLFIKYNKFLIFFKRFFDLLAAIRIFE